MVSEVSWKVCLWVISPSRNMPNTWSMLIYLPCVNKDLNAHGCISYNTLSAFIFLRVLSCIYGGSKLNFESLHSENTNESFHQTHKIKPQLVRQ